MFILTLHTYTHTHLCIHTHTHIHIHTHIHTHIYTIAHLQAHMYTHTILPIHTSIQSSSIHTHTQKHTRTHSIINMHICTKNYACIIYLAQIIIPLYYVYNCVFTRPNYLDTWQVGGKIPDSLGPLLWEIPPNPDLAIIKNPKGKLYAVRNCWSSKTESQETWNLNCI